jgi:hypothetical protein
VTGMETDAARIEFEPCSTWAEDFRAALLRHYTGSRGAPPGKKQGWRIIEWRDGRASVVGYVGLGEPTYKLAPRRALGLSDARPPPCTVSNFLFRLEGDRVTKASHILRAWEPVASAAWRDRYGWLPVHWESMVGQGDSGVLGACFRGARWRAIGWTTGRGARRQEGNSRGPRTWFNSSPKLVFYRGPLHRIALSPHCCQPSGVSLALGLG